MPKVLSSRVSIISVCREFLQAVEFELRVAVDISFNENETD